MSSTLSIEDITRLQMAWNARESLTPDNVDIATSTLINRIIALLDQGTLRVATPEASGWQTSISIKQAILLYFKIHAAYPIDSVWTQHYDKVPLKYQHHDKLLFQAQKVRIVPPASVRFGAYIGPGCVIMPSFINIGAYIDENTLIDTWATIGSAAQIGARVHISGGVGIGGVLEPVQASPTIIGNDCFIGARSEVVEGVVIGNGAVLSMGVYIGQSTRIYDRVHKKIYSGYVPEEAVVVPGTLPSEDGTHGLYAAIIVKYATTQTRQKVGINQLLREAIHGNATASHACVD